MALEDLTGTKYIDDLVATNPTATDDVAQGDDHIRGIKNVIKVTLPNVTGAITPTHTELNYVDGVTSAIQTQIDNTVTTANAALPKAGGAMTGAITTNSTFDTRDVATDGTKLDTIATGANLFVHPTTAGNIHIPTGGSAGQVLKYSSSGTAVWGTDENDAVAMAIALG
jgi:hypothetical protein|tara:strand:- start:71 stop:577 length:507 start_codon:yes stop_codon:yes gene_type:complete